MRREKCLEVSSREKFILHQMKNGSTAESSPIQSDCSGSADDHLYSTGKHNTEKIQEAGTRTEHYRNNIGRTYIKIKSQVFRRVSALIIYHSM